MSSQLVKISYNELLNFEDDNNIISISKAFGCSDTALGLIVITGVPGFVGLRSGLLQLAHQLGTSLSDEDLESLTVESAGYQVGWSHGKERVEGDKFDTGKGSFYANPLTDDPVKSVLDRDYHCADASSSISTTTSKEKDENKLDELVSSSSRHKLKEGGPQSKEDFLEMAKKNPAFYAPNVWPTKRLPDLETNFKEMGNLIRDVGVMVAKLCDAYVLQKCPNYTPRKLENIIVNSLCCKARLLHYFPTNESISPNDFSSWCGWHNDHGSLTGLVPAMYFDPEGNEIPCPDPSAGLYIKSRKGDLIPVKIPPDALAFQVGETTQIHTGGIFQATPHAVRGCDSSVDGVSREAFAVFMEPEYYGDMEIPSGRTIADSQNKESEEFLPRTVKTLRSRWQPGMNFGEFSDATFAAFH